MERRNRYEVLQEDVSTVNPVVEESTGLLNRRDDLNENIGPVVVNTDNKTDDHLVEPPSYTVAVELPTYEEYEKSKEEDEERAENAPQQTINAQMSLISDESSRHKTESVIGTDGMFALGFVFAFLFNWLGLLLAFCLMHNCAGRFGALSGFGLSIVKWVAIAKRNNWTAGYTEDDSWIWWLLITFGVLICCSGSLQYIRIKYLWSRMRNGYAF